jgi:hypothetical protein
MKPAFDPSSPFTTAPPSASASGKPAFDPSAAFTTSAPQELPDVGGPAMSWGQQEFSPGVPAVNQAVDVLARSAHKNINEPIMHPIETVTGLGRLGAGLAQYAGQGALGEGYKPDVDALVQDYATTYGTGAGFKKALTEDPVRVAMDATMGWGALRGLGRRAGVVSRPPEPVAAPNVPELREAAQGHYQAMHGFGVELHPTVMADVATNIGTELRTEGYRAKNAPKVFDAIEELRNPEGQFMTTQEIESTRRALNKAALDPAERDAARRAISHIDDALASLRPNDAAVNPQFAERVSQEALKARANYAAYKQADQIESATSRAELNAAATGSGANIDNATRQQIKNLLNNPKKLRGYTSAEIADMRAMVAGTFTGNAARLLGKLAPTGVVSGALGTMLGEAVGHSVGVPVLGYVAKKIGDAATGRAAARLSETRRLRSPEARRLGATATGPLVPKIARKALIGSQLGRISNEGNEP